MGGASVAGTRMADHLGPLHQESLALHFNGRKRKSLQSEERMKQLLSCPNTRMIRGI